MVNFAKKELAMVNKTGKGIVEHQEKGNKIVDMFRLIAFSIVFGLQIINDDEKRNHNARCYQ
jgi:hypothetical protein